MNWICLRCGNITRDNGSVILKCGSCGHAIPSKQYAKLIVRGRDIVKHGIFYRRAYEEQICKHGRIRRWYSLHDPTLVETAIGIVVSGVLGGFSYDVVKGFLTNLYGRITKWKIDPALTSDQQPSKEDLDLVFRLLDQESRFTETFVGLAQDWVNDRKSPYPQVRAVIEDERLGDQYAFVLKSDPAHFVYVVSGGSRFHRRSCSHLAPPRQRIRVKDAIVSKYSPCSRCKPLENVVQEMA